MRKALPIARIVLLGFMSSGKSVTGRALARRLGWDFIDFDHVIEQREERSVTEIMDVQGEEYFRRLEAGLTREVARRQGLVIAPGGGWITHPALLGSLRPGALAVWLRVSPAETLRRLDQGGTYHPLADDPEPLQTITALLAQREPLYRRADLIAPGDGRSIEEIAFEIEFLVRTRHG